MRNNMNKKITIKEIITVRTGMIISVDSHVIGMVVVHVTKDDDTDVDGYVTNLSIDKEYRRKGYATVLMNKVLEKFGHLELELSPIPDDDNITKKQLKAFYRSFGFKESTDGSGLMYRKPK